MIDFAKLKAPSDDGGVLVLPEPADCVAVLQRNATALGGANVPLLGSTLANWRRKTRAAVAGSADAPVIVTGHEPAFIHPGVWAKHIVARRLADAVDGAAINLVVDSAAPTRTTLPVPTTNGGRLESRAVRFADSPAGFAFEQIQRHGTDEIARFERALRETLGERYDRSQLPSFFAAFRKAEDASDWVDQALAARRAVEGDFGVVLDDRRVSRIWWTPLLGDMLLNAERFSYNYNRALAKYRARNRIRGINRPIPDLASTDGVLELPVWVYRRGEARRRLFVARDGDSLRLLADRVEIGRIRVADLERCEDLGSLPGAPADWCFRPRALALTMWARLLLADLFVHGIGGAKYDRISDTIIADYYGITPPKFACVSATLWMDLPHEDTTLEAVRHAQRRLRDLEWNPQRHLALTDDLLAHASRRDQALRRADQLREHDPTNHAARRDSFQEIRRISGLMLSSCPDALQSARGELDRCLGSLDESKVARGREYFFGLYDRTALERLLDALPSSQAFRA